MAVKKDYTKEEIRKIVYEVLPKILREHPEVRIELWNLLSSTFAPREQTEERFEKLLNEIKKLREETAKRFEEHDRRFEEHQKQIRQLFDEIKKLREETAKRFEEHDRRFEEHQKQIRQLFDEIKKLREETAKRFEEHDRRFEEHSRRLEEHDRRFEELLKEIRRVDSRIDRTIGALGARWGLSTEHAFREAIKSVIEELTGLKVERYLSYDSEGEVFGYPDQVELDIVIKNETVWVMEIKSSVSKADAYIFSKKVNFYEKKEGKKVSRKIIVSPMIDPAAKSVAENLGIEYYTAPEDMPA